MKAIYSLSLTVAAVLLLALSMPVHASNMDSRIESTARKSHVFKTYLQSDDIKIESREGVVTLTGTVTEEFHKSLAQETVADLPGVKLVDNQLVLKEAAPPENSDAWVMMKVKTALWLHHSLSGLKFEVVVNEGIVTLNGEATSEAQKELATAYAKDVQGVKDVKNEMTVSNTPGKMTRVVGKIDDASITAQVKMTLLFHRSTSALSTKVETKGGVVTMYGKANNASEKDLVNKLVRDIQGVKRVNNRMTIE
jgi:hyperosmotically inducible protein